MRDTQIDKFPAQRCVRLARCCLDLDEAWHWPLAGDADAVEATWQRRVAATPALFNGETYLACDVTLDGDALCARMFRTDFKRLLYWRAQGSPPPVREVFGAALLRSAEGHVLLGRQGPGHLHSGMVYPPSGVLCDEDLHGAAIDIDASAVRELREETGLDADTLQRTPGYLVALTGAEVAIAVEWRSPSPAELLRRRIRDFIAHEAAPELDDVIIVTSSADIDAKTMPDHAQLLLHSVLST